MASAAADEQSNDDLDLDKDYNKEEYSQEILDIIEDKAVETVGVPPILMEDVSVIHNIEDSPMRCKTENVTFPLTKEDKTDLARLLLRFEASEHLAGLSAPQIGLKQRAFVFEIQEDPDNTEEQTFRKNVWLNPTYRNAEGATLEEDYESCISIKNGEDTAAVGPVFRFNKIFYRAYDMEGRILEGEAKGFAARVIQHEIDHLDGKLFADYVQPEKLLTLEEFGTKLNEGTLEELQEGIVPELL